MILVIQLLKSPIFLCDNVTAQPRCEKRIFGRTLQTSSALPKPFFRFAKRNNCIAEFLLANPMELGDTVGRECTRMWNRAKLSKVSRRRKPNCSKRASTPRKV